MSLPSDHGVIALAKMLDDLDGRHVRVSVDAARLAPGGTTMVQSSFPSDPDRDLEQLAVKVSEVLARRQDGRL